MYVCLPISPLSLSVLTSLRLTATDGDARRACAPQCEHGATPLPDGQRRTRGECGTRGCESGRHCPLSRKGDARAARPWRRVTAARRTRPCTRPCTRFLLGASAMPVRAAAALAIAESQPLRPAPPPEALSMSMPHGQHTGPRRVLRALCDALAAVSASQGAAGTEARSAAAAAAAASASSAVAASASAGSARSAAAASRSAPAAAGSEAAAAAPAAAVAAAQEAKAGPPKDRSE
mmetsp:Transcript_19793/g.58700  ORF Transcript_19793/g.58700 Transcript_19793/m.58700 type:complete len:235 (+) Transcript_19793:53-757(+)